MDTGEVGRPFAVDCDAVKLAGIEYTIDRRDHVEVTDEKLLAAAGLMRQSPDYIRIRKLLLDGKEVPGARLAGIEYILRRKPIEQGAIEI